MLRVVLFAAVLVLAVTVVAPAASACCHLYSAHQRVGPCTADWRGDGFAARSDSVGASCTAAGQTVGYTLERCLGDCQ